MSVRKVMRSTPFYKDRTFQSHTSVPFSLLSSFSPLTGIKPTFFIGPHAVQGSPYAGSLSRIQRCRDKFQGLWQITNPPGRFLGGLGLWFSTLAALKNHLSSKAWLRDL